ncbi:MAG: 23S rRNA (guanosine(2251)-2'-O)-methyltransferase RlmB [Acidobacteria bacterium]|nr:23S rRNA (guanosine(2251)-2'-O)-methyltransferase RlmB [Acidobacteriota bacterium]
MNLIAGLHPVVEALRGKRPLDRVVVAKGAGGARLQEVIDLCRAASVPVRFEPRAALDRLCAGVPHQGVAAFPAASASQYADLEDLLPAARMIVMLDGIEDPHNLGAIARTVHAAGGDAIVIPERRAAGVTAAVEKAAAGALAHLPVVRVVNLNRAMEQAKEAGFWIYGLDERGQWTYDQIEYNPPTVLVAGAEGRGLHEQVKKHCDDLVRIPLAGAIASLNVSVALGIAIFEWKRRSRAK